MKKNKTIDKSKVIFRIAHTAMLKVYRFGHYIEIHSYSILFRVLCLCTHVHYVNLDKYRNQMWLSTIPMTPQYQHMLLE